MGSWLTAMQQVAVCIAQMDRGSERCIERGEEMLKPCQAGDWITYCDVDDQL